jgi:CcmD family protein
MRLLRALVCAALLAAPAVSAAQPKPSPDQFEPVTEVAPEDQIPAMWLLGTAYGFVWVALIGYVWSVSRRLQTVERELGELERRRP